ncbi:hypothetical protein [Clostridium hydrogeniformans]|uniref:hypothetical protein n=1 Tax=Clostridium hydrogeniformans TaxID=349933 RepID=UPI000485C9CF|nr:hypothetical protein [Clostridium hydrogeniformans]
MSKKNKDIDLPDIQEFLKLSRTFIRQLGLLKNNDIPEEYKDIISNSIDLVYGEIAEYYE